MVKITVSRLAHPRMYEALEISGRTMPDTITREYADNDGKRMDQERLDAAEAQLSAEDVRQWAAGEDESMECLPGFDQSFEGSGLTPVNCWTYFCLDVLG